MESRKPRVGVIFGGPSSEHGISCVSAGNVLAAINTDRWEVLAIGITGQGAWRLLDAHELELRIVAGVVPHVPDVGTPVMLPPDPTVAGIVDWQGNITPLDVVFPVMHGYGGEDGTIQGVCELAGIAVVGAGVAASAVCMDKIRTKSALAAHGLPIGGYVGISSQEWPHRRDEIEAEISALPWPVFVKPARAGSSMGISKVSELAELDAAIKLAREYDQRVIVEAGIIGAREIECGVLATATGVQASVCAEIQVASEHEFYDFTAKYLDGSTSVTVPAYLPSDISREIQDLAVRTFEALGCAGMARVDVFLTDSGEILINEPNTIPGFTSSSMYPVMWQASGVGYTELIDALLDDAIARAKNPEISG